MFEKVFSGKTVLVTGHTGFKGSWLSLWLMSLGARVVGVSLAPKTRPSCFEEIKLGADLEDLRIDIRDRVALEKVILHSQPDFVFHLAAQPLVKESYSDPATTAEVNIIGTVNLLNSLRSLRKECVAVLITSDKAYKNEEIVWGYRETDTLGGEDPYSASKGAAELMIHSFRASFFPKNHFVRVGIARAGNVIGGGDWNPDRLVPDCVRAWSKAEAVNLRYPDSTRPWQHVLEPLGGYLLLAVNLKHRSELHGEAFNFGPNSVDNHSVRYLVQSLAKKWGGAKWTEINEETTEREAGLLQLNCDKALYFLCWRPMLGFDRTLNWTAKWYVDFTKKPEGSKSLMLEQIKEYQTIVGKADHYWGQQR